MLDHVREAYSRFKAMVYHDTNDLMLREQLARFEEGDLNRSLVNLSSHLHDYFTGRTEIDDFAHWLDSIEVRHMPKKVEGFDHRQRRSPQFLTNAGEESIVVSKTTRFFRGPIELHMISTLWIMLEGKKTAHPANRFSYGNQLALDESGEFKQQRQLFVPYFIKYQEWRNKGIAAAREQIEGGNNVLLVSLDIQDFFNSVRIDFNALRIDLNLADHARSFTTVIEVICQHYSKIIHGQGSDHISLPIGLAASGVLANWHMKRFDDELNEVLRPVYYGRYVDDMFIVLANVTPPQEVRDWRDDPSASKAKRQNWKNPSEWFFEKFFTPEVGPLILSHTNKGEVEGRLTGAAYAGLLMQSEKVKLFHFDPQWPLASLKKFEHHLKESSSVFWLLPEEVEGDTLDENAFDLHYKDSEFSFRSLDDVRYSKFGASSHLAKKIRLAICSKHTADQDLKEQVKRILQGGGLVLGSGLWEKVLTYYMLVQDDNSFAEIASHISKGIDKVSSKEGRIESDNIKTALRERLVMAMAMAGALRPKVLEAVSKRKSDKERNNAQRAIELVPLIRMSMLLRHYYLKLPILALSGYARKTLEPLVDERLMEQLIGRDVQVEDELKTEHGRAVVPRWISLWECSLLEFIHDVGVDAVTIDTQEAGSARYYSRLASLYQQVNGALINDLIKVPELQPIVSDDRVEEVAVSITSKDKKDLLRIGLTNMRVDQKQVGAEIRDGVRLTRAMIDQHFRILNEAERDKADVLLLPECAVPLDLVSIYADRSRRQQRAMIMGLKHITVGKACYNFSMTVLPLELHGMRDAILFPRLKNHYGLGEAEVIAKARKVIPRSKPYRYHLFNWRGIHFSVYNCYELADVTHRGLFRSRVEVLFAIELNQDTNYFSNIAETVSRDVHCYFVQANTSDFGDTRIVQPSKTERMDIVRVKGGENDVVLIGELNIAALRDFQRIEVTRQTNGGPFKRTPPDFNHDQADDRNN